MKFLAAGLADEAREGAVPIEALAHAAVERAEGRGGAGEVDAREVLARERDRALFGAVAGHELDHAVRQTGRAQQLEAVPHADRGGVARLPERDVAEQHRRGGEVHRDGEEVERRDREDEALERAVVGAVPLTGHRTRLHGEDLPREGDVEAEEVDELAGGVDLGLVAGLRVAEHAGGVDARAPRPGEEIRGAEEDRRALFEGQRLPRGRDAQRTVDRLLHLRGRRVVHAAEAVRVIVRHHDVGGAAVLAGEERAAVDHGRDLDDLGRDLREGDVELRALGRAGREARHGLVLGEGDLEDAVDHPCFVAREVWVRAL